jgi:hypothetical protein
LQERDSEASKEEQTNDSDSAKLSSFVRRGGDESDKMDDSDLQGDDQEESANDQDEGDTPGGPKKKRRKKRFRLTTLTQKTKSKLLRVSFY